VQGVVDDLRLDATKLNKHQDRSVSENFTHDPGIVAPAPELAIARPSAGPPVNGPKGASTPMTEILDFGQSWPRPMSRSWVCLFQNHPILFLIL